MGRSSRFDRLNNGLFLRARYHYEGCFFGRAVCVRTATSPPPLFGTDGSMCIPVIPGCFMRAQNVGVRQEQPRDQDLSWPHWMAKTLPHYAAVKKKGRVKCSPPFLANWCQPLHRLQACTTYNGDDSTNSIHNVFSPPPFIAGPCVFRAKGREFHLHSSFAFVQFLFLKKVPIEKQKLVRG